jgi:glycosyltransferase involved in cell wall biosynthesis
MMRFSIIIPSYNRPRQLGRCLTSLAQLNYPRDQFEVIVVDDGSVQPVAEVTRGFLEQLQLKTLRQENAGPARARNFGAECANGEVLAFLDDDCTPDRDWLSQLDVAAVRHPGCLLGGKATNGCRDNIFAETNQRLLDTLTAWFICNNSPLQFFASNNLAVPAVHFRQLGGFDPNFPLAGGEDRDFCARWLGSGRRLISTPDAHIDHFHPQTVHSYLKMHFRYGRGAARLHRLRQSSPLRLANKGLYKHLLFTFARGNSRFTASVLLILSQLATVSGFVYEARELRHDKPTPLSN